MPFTIRPYHPSDLVALYRVCLQTGDSGKDARHLCRDEELLGHCYVAPYAVLEPDLCFVLLDDGAPRGYVLGTRDSPAFRIQTEQEWFPVLRTRYAFPSDTDHSRDAACGIQFADQRAALHRLVLHERNRTRQRTRIAAPHGCSKRRELHAHLRDPE